MNYKNHKTLRKCVSCKRNTLFEYNKRIGHSECTKCGNRFAEAVTSEDIFKDNLRKIVLAKLELRLNELSSNVEGAIFRRKELRWMIKTVGKI